MTNSSRAKIPDKLRRILSNLDTPAAAPGGAVDWDDVTGKPSTFSPSAHTHSTSEVTGLDTVLSGKQATLVSATNIKTINGSSVLGAGDLVVSGSGGGSPILSWII